MSSPTAGTKRKMNDEYELRTSLLDRYKKPRLDYIPPPPQPPPHEARYSPRPLSQPRTRSRSPQSSQRFNRPMPDSFNPPTPILETGNPEFDRIIRRGDLKGTVVKELENLLYLTPLDTVGRTRACIWAARTGNKYILRTLVEGVTWQSILDLTPELHPHDVIYRIFSSTISSPKCFNELVLHAKIPFHDMAHENSKLVFAMYRAAIEKVLVDPAPLRNLNSYQLPYASYKYILERVLDTITKRVPDSVGLDTSRSTWII